MNELRPHRPRDSRNPNLNRMGSKKDQKMARDAITLGGLQNKALRASSSVLEALEEIHGPDKWLHGRVKVRGWVRRQEAWEGVCVCVCVCVCENASCHK